MTALRLLVIVFATAIVGGCSSGHPGSPPLAPTPSGSASTSLAINSRDLTSGHWPAEATCDGADNPPDLHWTAGPAGTMSYAIQVFDPDAPNGGFTHWMLANEPSNLRQPTPSTGVSGRNDFGKEGYAGPCPPTGSTHRYVVTVYAVDTMLSLQPLYHRQDFERALTGHVLAQASITATYGR